MKILTPFFLLLMLTISSCHRNEKDVGSDDELDLQREEEYRPGDFSERELELNN